GAVVGRPEDAPAPGVAARARRLRLLVVEPGPRDVGGRVGTELLHDLPERPQVGREPVGRAERRLPAVLEEPAHQPRTLRRVTPRLSIRAVLGARLRALLHEAPDRGQRVVARVVVEPPVLDVARREVDVAALETRAPEVLPEPG